MATTHQHIN